MSKDLAAKTAVTVAAGLATPMDPIDEMELEKMRKVVERRQAFDRAVDKVLKERIPAQGRKGHVLPLRLHPDPILSEVCEPIEKFDKLTGGGLKGLIADMAFTMTLCGGAGLAAPQIGLPYRLFVMDVEAKAGVASNLRVFINPEVISAANLIRMEEGCLSAYLCPAFDLGSCDIVRFTCARTRARANRSNKSFLDGTPVSSYTSWTILRARPCSTVYRRWS
jgi:hypothetical protein